MCALGYRGEERAGQDRTERTGENKDRTGEDRKPSESQEKEPSERKPQGDLFLQPNILVTVISKCQLNITP